jgi:hypothetical protein
MAARIESAFGDASYNGMDGMMGGIVTNVPGTPVVTRTTAILAGLFAAAALLAGAPATCAEEAARRFFRGLNLNGPPVEIDGEQWEGQESANYTTDDRAFENQAVPLRPATDEARALMVRSSRWNHEARIRLTNVPAGRYSVFIYVWEDNDPEIFSVLLQGRAVVTDFRSGEAGEWRRLGPFAVDVGEESTIELTSRGGAANFSGIEIWTGDAPSPAPGEPINPLPDISPEATARFRGQVAPLLVAHCLECHNSTEAHGGLDLSDWRKAMTGGESGAAIVPRQPDESLLWLHVAADEMPKDRPVLNASEKLALRDWILEGAPWADRTIDPFLVSTSRRAGYDWWSLQPVRRPEPPVVNDVAWPRNEIDRFVLAKLEASGLHPSREADRRSLIRRLYFDLWGLPPTPEDVAEFVADDSPRAYERLVDRLLDSPHYGERWARHWLDVIRFGESQGFERNKLRPNAWKFRDFVVEAFNADLPYDEFVRWQVAGDVLRPDDPIAVVASGMIVMGPYDLTAYTDGTPDMRAAARQEELEGLVGTVSQTFLGLTMNCARCHDHKFDPVTQREYYQFAAALAGTYHGDERESLTDAGRGAATERAAAWRAELTNLDERSAPPGARGQAERAARRSRLEALVRLVQGGPAHVSVPQDAGVVRVLARGDFRQPGEGVSPRGIRAIATLPADWGLPADAPEGARRRALAEWIVDARNPLTARVIVNRLWGRHFGAAIVATPSDFGFQGARPSHPELLDWLADELIHPSEGGPWRLKRLQRMMVLSATYRQSSSGVPAAAAIDAENRLLWRYMPQRLDAESIRDAVLAVSGDLDPRVGGPGFRDFTVSSAGNNETYTVSNGVGPEFHRRSLYRTWLRTGTSPLLDVLDCPDPSVATPRRSVTTTPLQALALLNNEFMVEQASRFAARLEREVPGDEKPQIVRAHALAFGRAADEDEVGYGVAFVKEYGLNQYCLVLFNANEFLYID